MRRLPVIGCFFTLARHERWRILGNPVCVVFLVPRAEPLAHHGHPRRRSWRCSIQGLQALSGARHWPDGLQGLLQVRNVRSCGYPPSAAQDAAPPLCAPVSPFALTVLGG
eukprot:10341900-Heterocapsa_arctica.AAC.1